MSPLARSSSLSGRSAMLGDSFRRNPKDRDALLAARTKDLEGLTRQLRGFDLDQYVGEGTEGEGPVPWAVGEDETGDRSTGRRRSQLPARVLVVLDYAKWKEHDSALSEIRAAFLRALPGLSVAVRGAWGPFEDDEGFAWHFDGSVGSLTGTKKIKRLRGDLLTSCLGLRCFEKR